MKLEDYLYKQKEKKDILLMTHIVIGYPTLAKSSEIVSAMVNAGADLIELQIPSSEPIADGPVIRDANRKALAGGVRVQNCIDFAADVVSRFDIPFLFMCYYDVLFKFGLKRFTQTMADHGIRGAIVPDIPPEEGSDYLKAMASHDLAPISIFTPSMPLERMQRLSDCGRGFIYCVAREGVTGSDTEFSAKLDQYLQRCRQATALPLALGFGVKSKADVDFLKNRADIAVIGTQTIRLLDQQGLSAVETFLKGLR